jgi:hypothetical protein
MWEKYCPVDPETKQKYLFVVGTFGFGGTFA